MLCVSPISHRRISAAAAAAKISVASTFLLDARRIFSAAYDPVPLKRISSSSHQIKRSNPIIEKADALAFGSVIVARRNLLLKA